MASSTVDNLYNAVKAYHDESGDPRAGNLVSLLYEVKDHADKDNSKKDAK